MKITERLKSWAVWVSVLGAVGVLLNSFGLFDKMGMTAEMWDVVINTIGTILIAFGILNNPTDRDNF